ncbi:hypothetical protein FXF51_47635 [Nonomuraea sp. PA05]|uniref:hypothetical protein n=1 Tax=Nonomuraea sp. PA05 TaxID=2604466 RepID=UPI0011D83F36|nr:hypothetical protein [Nonomuraea sp. PA05]TYB54317.1 hypothetical protein FXF51_47635 [Nonomuraea sp. PA05]
MSPDSKTFTWNRPMMAEVGSWGKQTGKFDCSGPGRPANAYARAQDVTSGRWSAGVPVRVGRAVY